MHPSSLRGRFLIAIASAALCASLRASVATDARDMIVWYKQPGKAWMDASPLGNGITAAMVFGGTQNERIALNDSSFWSGRPHDYDDPEAIKYYPRIKELVFAEKFQEAEKMVNEHFWGIPKAQQAYQPLGDLLLDFDGVGELRTTGAN
jgi:alpha-L-fucosidase 2